jgi:hypothetical protein
MFLAPRSPITRLLMAGWYAVAALAGQGLHLLAHHGHDHETALPPATVQAEADRDLTQGRAMSGPAVEANSGNHHDTDECPICQYHSQGQWHRSAESVAMSAAVTLVVRCDTGLASRQSLDRPFGPRGPPSSSASLA